MGSTVEPYPEFPRGAVPPAVLTEAELSECVDAVRTSGIFCFDVETRGVIEHHPDVMALVAEEWEAKKATLKSTNESVLKRSYEAICDAWVKDIALDPLRNEVSWIAIAIAGQSWAIPISHRNGEVLVPEERGDGSTTPPSGYRATLISGKESMAKAKYYIPATYTAPPQQLSAEMVWTALEPLFMDESIPKVNANIQFDCRTVAKYIGGLPKGDYIDTQTLQHVINENMLKYSLESVIHTNYENHDPYWRHGKLGAVIEHVSFSKATLYGHLDARWAWLSYLRMWNKLSRVSSLLESARLDIAATRPMAQATQSGILVNRRQMVKLGKELEVELNHILVEMAEFAPIGFNPGSDQHKRALLFNKKREGGLGLKPKKMTKGGKDGQNKVASVDASTMESLSGEHPMVDLLLKHAKVEQLKSTFVDGMLPLLHNGRAHPNFHFHKTVTSRMSCSSPNLHNQARDERIRSLFLAEPGNSLIVADYSAIELRILAALSGDKALHHIFLNNIDPHLGTAAGILKIAPEEVTHEQRNTHGKIPNFLLGYGGGPKRLVEAANGALTLAEATEIYDGYDEAFPELAAWKKQEVVKATRLGYASTLGGRRRRLPDLQSNDKYVRLRAERQVSNHISQGTAAEICKRAVIATDQVLEFPKCRLMLQVHDELVMSVPTEEVNYWEPQVLKAMGDGDILMGVPLKVSIAHGGTWAEAK